MAGTCITGTTKVLAVIGDPVKHSLSPLMHNAALAALGLDYVYLAFPHSGRKSRDGPGWVCGHRSSGLQHHHSP